MSNKNGKVIEAAEEAVPRLPLTKKAFFKPKQSVLQIVFSVVDDGTAEDVGLQAPIDTLNEAGVKKAFDQIMEQRAKLEA